MKGEKYSREAKFREVKDQFVNNGITYGIFEIHP